MNEHECRLVLDEDGQVVARALCAPVLSEPAKAALAELVAAVRRDFAVQCEQDLTLGGRLSRGSGRGRGWMAGDAS